MSGAAALFHLASTFAFSAMALTVGVRLLRLWRRTGQAAEGLLGAGLGGAGGGYGVLVGAGVLGATGVDPESLRPFVIAGWAVHNAGVVGVIGFVVHVFRPDARWARALWIGAGVVLWTGFAGQVFSGSLGEATPSVWYWVMLSVIGTYPIWGAFESLRYHRLMRRRRELGLADSLVTNRFLCWSVAELCTLGAIWLANWPAWHGDLSVPAPVWVTLLTAILGCCAVGAYALTFFPPAWYRARMQAADAARAAAAS